MLDVLKLKFLKQKNKKIKGFLDGIDGNYVYGWAWDPENPERRLKVVVYVDGEPVAEGIADEYREDLERAGIGDGRYGFRIKLDERIIFNSNERLFSVKLEELNYELINSPIRFKFPTSIIGNVDEFRGLSLYGWVFDLLNPSERVAVWVYVDNILYKIIKADKFRIDLKEKGIGDGYHGFDISFDEKFLDGNLHTITLKAYDVYEIPGSPIKINFLSDLTNICLMPTYINESSRDLIFYPFQVQYDLFSTENHFSLFEDDKFVEQLLQDIDNLIMEKKIKLISLDVFDTVLLRNQKSEIRRFFEISQKFSELTKVNWLDIFLLRIIIHKESYIYSIEGEDGTIEGNYIEQIKILCEILDLAKFLDKLIEIEVNYELENTYLNPFFIRLLKYTKEKCLDLVFTTDMYFPNNIIEKIIQKKIQMCQININSINKIKIFSSASYLKSKRMGGIFDELLKEYNLKTYADILHIGDNYESDYLKPKEKGVNTYLLPLPEKVIYDRFIDFKKLVNELSELIPLDIIDEYIKFNL